MFTVASGPDEDSEPTFVRPPWFGPPEGELGVSLPLAVVVGRSDNAVVALRDATAYSMGVALELVAAARGLRQAEAQTLFHEQHFADPDDELPAAFLRVGLELPDGTRVSNLTGHRAFSMRPEQEPDAPLLVPSGGGGGSAGPGHVTMSPAYWLWPLPPAGTLRLFVEWPRLGVALSSCELDGAAIRSAAAKSQPLWADEATETGC